MSCWVEGECFVELISTNVYGHFELFLSVCCLNHAWMGFSCERVERDEIVRIIVPDGFRGILRIVFETDASNTIQDKKELVFKIPEDGTLIAKGKNPFLKLGEIEVRYGSEKILPSASEQIARGKSPVSNEILFRIVGGTNDGSEFWAVVGTEKDWEDANLNLNDLEAEKHKNNDK